MGGLRIALDNWSKAKNVLMNLLGESCAGTQWVASFEKLNQYKQVGFYVDRSETKGFAAPEEINVELARAVHEVAFRMSDLLRFVVGSDVSRYQQWIASMRDKLGPDTALRLRASVQKAMHDELEEAYNVLSNKNTDAPN